MKTTQQLSIILVFISTSIFAQRFENMESEEPVIHFVDFDKDVQTEILDKTGSY